MVDCAEKLRTLRTARGITQKQLATRLGISKAMVSAYENATKAPSIEVLIRIAALFGVTVDYLVSVEPHATVDCAGLDDDAVALVAALVEKLRAGGANNK